MTSENLPKIHKQKSPLRWEAFLPLSSILALIILYFILFFDHHAKKAIETVGYHVVGAEVNIQSFQSSFLKASMEIKGLEITDSENPTRNSIKIGDIRYGLLWDALLRAKFVVNEIAVEQIEFHSPRKSPGKVKPPEPIEPASNKPNVAVEEGKKVAQMALDKTKDIGKDTALADAISLLQGSSDLKIDQFKDNLPSKVKIQEIEKDFNLKQATWKTRLATLPQTKDIQILGERLNKVKIKDFKNIEEVQNSLKEIDVILKEGDSKFKVIQSASADFNQDLQKIDADIKTLNQMIQTDIDTLKKHFKIPQIDAKSLAKSVFMQYAKKYLDKLYHYKSLAEKYLPPKLASKVMPGQKQNTNEKSIPIQPHPRDHGISYEFGRAQSYPLFWIKRTHISSKAGVSPHAGDLDGEILNITSNQTLIQKPTEIRIKGDFPGIEIRGLRLDISLDNRPVQSEIKYTAQVQSYPIEQKTLIQSNDINLNLTKAQGAALVNGQLTGLSNLKMIIQNDFKSTTFQVNAENSTADEILKKVFTDMTSANLNASISGEIPQLAINIESDIGATLQRAFEKQINAKIDEAKKKIDAYVNEQVGSKKKELDLQYQSMKNQIESEIKKVQDQINSQKKVADQKTNQAKKETENQAKNKIEQEGKKALEDLKKKFNF